MSALRAAVVGGGIIGTAVARRLAREVPGVSVTLFEKEDRLAAHQTGHNSGVVHAGLYYPPGSLKARLCRRGVGLLTEFAERHGIRHEECGKIVVALDDSELARLDAIHDRARANGVPGLRMLDRDRIAEVEPHAVGLRALHSPHTGIIDFPGVTDALADELREAGGEIRLGRSVTALRQRGAEVVLESAGPESSGLEAFDLVIACAGLHSDRLARRSGESAEPRIVPFTGDYYLLPPEQRDLVNGLVYPVPDPRYPFLGVHLTRHVDGSVLLGPNAFLAPRREAYRDRPAARRYDVRDLAEAVGFPGFWRFAARNVPAAVREARTAASSRSFIDEARRYVPAIDPEGVVRGPRGVRAQAMDGTGRLVDDFVITGTDRVLHVRNAPSPGATSSLAIAEYVVSEALSRRGAGPGPDQVRAASPASG
ncbi:L-2-hydroxyglutarate oxidase [Nocardioides donggukensis]|uniref:L-2-hydroxyglutarate oxidase n=1 Tax=Nocardioides donggukensis TaxID=2774019 RepID=A0A927Q313_9ACTN|nr:L-2-hydroxyglutarate oxidase [Nocardioides donggukensis]MBD8870166.1 L-2-hydroxyglutarate oxidase [Nocardioides donggukensis]